MNKRVVVNDTRYKVHLHLDDFAIDGLAHLRKWNVSVSDERQQVRDERLRGDAKSKSGSKLHKTPKHKIWLL